MAFDVFFPSDLERSILAGLVLMVQTARAGDVYNVEFLTGAVAAFQHQAHTFGLDWLFIEEKAKLLLGRDLANLLAAALRLADGR